ncbi:MAG: THUMP domain-containing protein [Muribaculaceae bacterium]|nr:THUMP domain-containing protein [Muribaculaceae bacterium]
MNTKFEMVAKTFQGLEEVLRDELIDLGAENVEMGRRMVSFYGDNAMLYKANLCLRTALRILKPIAKFSASNPDELYDFVRDYEWDTLMTPDSTFAIDSTVNSAEFPHSKFVTYRVKDGIVDYFNDKYQRRPSIRLQGADVQLNVHISDDRITISLDSSGEPLNKRGYRVAQTEAPINEVLAAGLILKTGWRGDTDFVDPMCGSGTFLIEAALIAANVNPGVFRQNYAFEAWPDFDKELFEELYNDDSDERDPSCRIYGGDIAREAIAIAKENIHAAGVDDYIELECKPFQDWTEPPFEGILITNPPYGERLRPGDIEGLYKQIGTTLKHYFKGYHAWILGYKDEHFREIGLKASVTFPVLNGALECQMREYVLFEGTYADFKTGGGTVSNPDFHREAKPKVHRATDEEWRSQTRKFSAGKHDKSTDKRRENERREFKKDNRERPSDFRRDGKPFKKDGKPFKKEGKPFKKHDDYRDNRGERTYKPGKPVSFERKAPGLSRDNETRFAPEGRTMRSRKGWKAPK